MKIDWRKAAGELVIIIVGVMIALAADRWREARNNAQLASSYIARMRADLQADLSEFNRTVEWAEAVDESALYVLAVYRGRDPSPEEYDLFGYHLFSTSWAPGGGSTSATYDDLISTGNFALLPVGLRNAITDYYLTKESLIERRGRNFEQEAMVGYWRVPLVVLGPESAPAVWMRIQGNSPDFVPEVGSLELRDSDVQRIVQALRGIEGLEAMLAHIRHGMVQRRILFGERLPKAAQNLSSYLSQMDESH